MRFLSSLLFPTEICCCIMSELEIHVLSTPRSSVDSVEVSVSGVGGSQLCRKLIIDVCSGSGAPSARVIQPGAMQKDESRRMEVALEEAEKDMDEVLDEELESFMEGGVSSTISSSRPETPLMGTSPPIPIPPCMSPLLWNNFVGTPTRGTSFSRFHTPEATSPLSSGYGSMPRFFPLGTSTASTQTPPLSPLETIRVSFFSNSFNSPDATLSPGQRVRLRRQRLTEGENFSPSCFPYPSPLHPTHTNMHIQTTCTHVHTTKLTPFFFVCTPTVTCRSSWQMLVVSLDYGTSLGSSQDKQTLCWHY